nr:class I SAM-dependent methyltransferase [Paenibacillus uliginis]
MKKISVTVELLDYRDLQVLDLGCGVGRTSIPIEKF